MSEEDQTVQELHSSSVEEENKLQITNENVAAFISRSFMHSSGNEGAQRLIFRWAHDMGYLSSDIDIRTDNFDSLPDDVKQIMPIKRHPGMDENTIKETILDVAKVFNQEAHRVQKNDDTEQTLDIAFSSILLIHSDQMRRGLVDREGRVRTDSHFVSYIFQGKEEPNPVMKKFVEEMRTRAQALMPYINKDIHLDLKELKQDGIDIDNLDFLQIIKTKWEEKNPGEQFYTI